MSDQTPETSPQSEAERLRAIETLRAILQPYDVPVVFRAELESPSREFYWVTAHYRVADISVLVSNATGFPLDQGRFRHSIKDIIDKLKELDMEITNYRILDMDDLVQKPVGEC